jgi:hypothetical protein
MALVMVAVVRDDLPGRNMTTVIVSGGSGARLLAGEIEAGPRGRKIIADGLVDASWSDHVLATEDDVGSP